MIDWRMPVLAVLALGVASAPWAIREPALTPEEVAAMQAGAACLIARGDLIMKAGVADELAQEMGFSFNPCEGDLQDVLACVNAKIEGLERVTRERVQFAPFRPAEEPQ